MHSRMNEDACPKEDRKPTISSYRDDEEVQEFMISWLTEIWKPASEKRWFFVASRAPDGNRWRDQPIAGNEICKGLKEFFDRHSRHDCHLFFCPNGFSRPVRRQEIGVRTRLGWCDMDASEPDDYEPMPSLCWRTSPNRYQGIWLWDRWHAPAEAEAFSRSLAYSFGGDRNGWSITKMLRLPGSVNHKPEYQEPFVRLKHQNWEPLHSRPVIQKNKLFRCMAHVELAAPLELSDPEGVLEKYERRINHYICSLLRSRQVIGSDRSGKIFQMIAALSKVGASADEIISVLWVNPYFLSKHGKNLGRLELEVSRVRAKLGIKP